VAAVVKAFELVEEPVVSVVLQEVDFHLFDLYFVEVETFAVDLVLVVKAFDLVEAERVPVASVVDWFGLVDLPISEHKLLVSDYFVVEYFVVEQLVYHLAFEVVSPDSETFFLPVVLDLIAGFLCCYRAFDFPKRFIPSWVWVLSLGSPTSGSRCI